MALLQLILEPQAYELRLDAAPLGRLEGGAAALLAGARPPLREIHIETAIERAEDWLMPLSARFQGLALDVLDAAGRLRPPWDLPPAATLQDIEQAFTRVHDAVAHGRLGNSDSHSHSAADVVLLRELAHHGRLSGIRWHPGPPASPAPRG